MLKLNTVVLSIVLFFSPLSLASINSDAAKLLAEGRPVKAYELLMANNDADNVDPQWWFLLGAAAKQSGHMEEAKRNFELVLFFDPLAHRAKLELAAIAFQKGERQNAKQLLLEVKAANPPGTVLANIERFLAALDAGKGGGSQEKNWRVTSSLGWIYDSNANAGPDIDVIEFFGLPFLISDEAKNTEDSAAVAQLGFEHSVALSESVGWQSSTSLNFTDYESVDFVDSLVLSAASGPVWKQSPGVLWSLPVIANQVKVGHKDSYYLYALGVAPQLRYSLSRSLALNVGLSLLDKHYHDNKARDAWQYNLGTHLSWQLSEQSGLRLGVSAGQEDAALDTFSKDSIGASVSYYRSFDNIAEGLVASLNASYSDDRYREREIFYEDTRRDEISRIALTAAYPLKMLGAELNLSLSFTQNDSNLVIYDYEREQVSLSLKKAF